MPNLFQCIQESSKIIDRVLVSFSGGKDSVVVFDLCRKYIREIQPYFWYYVAGLEFQEEQMRWYEKKFSVNIIRVPHPDLTRIIRSGTFSFIPDKKTSRLSHGEISEYMRNLTGIDWIASGERKADSPMRRMMLKTFPCGINIKHYRIFPVSEWHKQEILQYIKIKRLPLSRESRLFGHSFGFTAGGKELYQIKQNFPSDYQKIKNVFPFIEALVKKYEFFGEENERRKSRKNNIENSDFPD